MRIVFLLLLCLSGCATQKQWTATGGSRADGTVKLSYEYGEFEVPRIETYEGTSLAASRCKSWGYSNAEPFGGIVRTCNMLGGFSGCQRWIVTAEYQCTTGRHTVMQPITAAPPESIQAPAAAPALQPATAPVQMMEPQPASASGYAPKAAVLPKNDYAVQQITRSIGCTNTALLGATASTETYQLTCPGGQYKLVQCEFTNCKVMQ